LNALSSEIEFPDGSRIYDSGAVTLQDGVALPSIKIAYKPTAR